MDEAEVFVPEESLAPKESVAPEAKNLVLEESTA